MVTRNTISENFEGAYLNKEHKKNQDFDSWSICEYKTSCWYQTLQSSCLYYLSRFKVSVADKILTKLFLNRREKQSCSSHVTEKGDMNKSIPVNPCRACNSLPVN